MPTILAWIWDFIPTSVVVYIMAYGIQIYIVAILYLVAQLDPQLSLIVKLCIYNNTKEFSEVSYRLWLINFRTNRQHINFRTYR